MFKEKLFSITPYDERLVPREGRKDIWANRVSDTWSKLSALIMTF